jgi:hypothetical protein
MPRAENDVVSENERKKPSTSFALDLRCEIRGRDAELIRERHPFR